MKKIYTISELVEIGYPRKLLYQLVHTKGFPCYQSKTEGGRGKFRINIQDLEDYLGRKGIRKA